METRERVLLRRKHGRVLAGVAGGLADYTETPVRWWRWAFAAVAVMGWLGLLVVTPPVLDLIGRGSTWGRLALLFVLFAGGVAEWAYLLLWVLVPRADLHPAASVSGSSCSWEVCLGPGWVCGEGSWSWRPH
jgi:phage shock protein PspC (stress-responsive transcriptional regulator)